ncbi:MAG: zinc-ribbon domain-containing protein [Phycisphaerae bacterium]|nr:zinc-ribbon domain-containing protein [Phycisphaerae bacterium]
MIRFECPSCTVRIRVPDKLAGKSGKCPKCRHPVTVPVLQDQPEDIFQLAPSDIPADPVLPGDDPLISESTAADEVDAKQTGQRSHPWPIDIFMYPMNQAGFVHLAIFVGIPLVVGLILKLLGPLTIVIWIVPFCIGIAVKLYYCWYIAECVNDSAGGGMRTPDAFSSADLSDQLSLAIHLGAAYVMFAGPAFFYHLYLHRMDALFWCLTVYGVIFFPMGLLAMVLYQDSSALNPFKLLLAIIKCLLPYLGLMVLLSLVLGLFTLLSRIPVLGQFFWVYGSFILAHLLGRFYWRNQARIGWF